MVPKKEGHIDLNELMRMLGEQGIDSILLEGGGTLNFSALKQGIDTAGAGLYRAETVRWGGGEKPGGGSGAALPSDGWQLSDISVRRIGAESLVEGDVKYSCLPE